MSIFLILRNISFVERYFWVRYGLSAGDMCKIYLRARISYNGI
jgi:hypothetical protein